MFVFIERIPYLRQWQAGLTLGLGAMTTALTAGWTSPYIAKLTAPESDHRLKLTYAEASWVASLLFIGRLFGGVFSAGIQDFIGRKKTLLCVAVPLAVGWSLIIVAPSVPWLYASRILTGMTVGMVFASSASFLGEIADPMIRGSLTIMIPNFQVWGVLFGSIMGGLLPMEIFSYVCLVLTGLLVVALLCIPESPYYYIANGDIQKAEESLKWYNKDADVEGEMRELQGMVGNKSVSAAKIFTEFRQSENQKNFIIVLCVSTFPYASGLNTVDAYAEIMLTKSKIDLTPSIVVMALSVSSVVAGIITLVLVDKWGRRPLLIVSGLGVALGHILLGLHFYMLSVGINPKSISWLPVLSYFLVLFSIPCGLGTIKDTLLSELFPPILKTPASFVYTANGAIVSFAISKSFQPYLDLVGEKFVFWTFAIVALSSVVFAYFCIPETTRISLKDIQDNLKKDNVGRDISTGDVETNVRVNK